MYDFFKTPSQSFYNGYHYYGNNISQPPSQYNGYNYYGNNHFQAPNSEYNANYGNNVYQAPLSQYYANYGGNNLSQAHSQYYANYGNNFSQAPNSVNNANYGNNVYQGPSQYYANYRNNVYQAPNSENNANRGNNVYQAPSQYNANYGNNCFQAPNLEYNGNNSLNSEQLETKEFFHDVPIYDSEEAAINDPLFHPLSDHVPFLEPSSNSSLISNKVEKPENSKVTIQYWTESGSWVDNLSRVLQDLHGQAEDGKCKNIHLQCDCGKIYHFRIVDGRCFYQINGNAFNLIL